MEGPYRDLGSGFARLSGAEAPRRAPSSIASVEDALLELLRNARDAGASNVYVASALRSRRYRSLTVIDDGRGVPEGYAGLIFEPGVTTRHLDPVRDAASPRGAGLALHHIRVAASEAKLAHPSSPTAFRAVFDTRAIPERSLQSKTRPSTSNLLATASSFAEANPATALFHASPAAILASLIKNHIILQAGRSGVMEAAGSLGLEVSSKTVSRVLRGEVAAAGRVGTGVRAPRLDPGGAPPGAPQSGHGASGGPSADVLRIGEDERAEVAAILGRAARASYLEVVDVKFEARPGEVRVTARVHEPEDEYE